MQVPKMLWLHIHRTASAVVALATLWKSTDAKNNSNLNSPELRSVAVWQEERRSVETVILPCAFSSHLFLCCRRGKTWFESPYGNPWWMLALCAAESCVEVAGWNVSVRVPGSCDPDDLVAVGCWLNSVLKNICDCLNVLWMERHYYSGCIFVPWPYHWTAASSAITDIKMQKGWEHLSHGYART